MTSGWRQKAIDKLIEARLCLQEAFHQLSDDDPAVELLAELIENTHTVEETLATREREADAAERLRRQQIIAERLKELR